MDNKIEELENVLLKIENRCDSIIRDCHEADKIHCHVGYILTEIAKVYPMYKRQVNKFNET